MTHKKMPHHRTQPLGVRSDALGGRCRNDDALIGDSFCIAAIFTDNSEHSRSTVARLIDRLDEIHGDLLFHVAAADRENQDRIAFADARDLQPLRETALPPFIVHTSGELRNVVRRRVRFELTDLAEIVDGVTGVTGGAADAEDEETSAAVPNGGERSREPVDRAVIDATDDIDRFVEIRAAERHA